MLNFYNNVTHLDFKLHVSIDGDFNCGIFLRNSMICWIISTSLSYSCRYSFRMTDVVIWYLLFSSSTILTFSSSIISYFFLTLEFFRSLSTADICWFFWSASFCLCYIRPSSSSFCFFDSFIRSSSSFFIFPWLLKSHSVINFIK